MKFGNRESGTWNRDDRECLFQFPIPDSRFSLFLAAFLLSACVSVLPDAPPASARFLISDIDYETQTTPPAPVEWTLGIEEPAATLAINTAKIPLARAPSRIEYYAGGEWVDRAPRLFGAALIRSFENSGRITGVGSRITLPISTYVLQTDIRKLTVAHDGKLEAETEIFARLTNGRSAVYASKLFKASEPAKADNAAAAAAALNEALSRIQRDLVEWTFVEAEKAASRK